VSPCWWPPAQAGTADQQRCRSSRILAERISEEGKAEKVGVLKMVIENGLFDALLPEVTAC